MRKTDSGVYIHELERSDIQYRLAKGDPCFDITVFIEDGEIMKLVISYEGRRFVLKGHRINDAIDVMTELVNRTFELEEPKDE